MEQTQTSKICQNCKQQFLIANEDFQFYERIKVPSPTFCPDCRLQRRMAFRNERSLYKDTCDLCKKSFVSMYSPDKPFTVYCKECWYSDNWDPLVYGQEYDWNRPFFEQFRELMRKVPRIGIMHIRNNVHSDYANYIADSKNTYLSNSIVESENIYFSRNIDKSKELIDCSNLKESEKCYEAVEGGRNYQIKFSLRSRDCINGAFLFDCVNCQNCFMCTNLRNSQYMIRNAQCTKEEYAAAMQELEKYSGLLALKKEFEERVLHALHKFAAIIKAANCTGNNIDNAKNAKYAFDVYSNVENVRYAVRIIGGKDSWDASFGVQPELCYEYIAGGHSSMNSKFLNHGDVTVDSAYTDWCHHSSNLFGCISLRKKEHCILNKQYSKEQYEKMKAKIIEQMDAQPYTDKRGKIYKYGEFFPTEFSPFAYNETIAEEYFPLTKEGTQGQGYEWREPDPNPYTPTVTADKLPDDIQSVPDSIIKEIIACSSCARVYHILQPELEFLRREGIALPRKCQECRHKARFALRNPLRLWHRRCVCNARTNADGTRTNAEKFRNTAEHFHGDAPCPNEFETSYAPERPEMVYCEACYNAEVS
jgi:hypothetical protein